MPQIELAKMEPVDVWDVWEHEARDLTPWLACNLDLLSEEIGFGLDLVDTEKHVNGYRLDILAESDGIGKIAIENQLSWSDNKHLGQLLSYASGLDVQDAIWVARAFGPAHIAALKWLNRWTPNELGFYAVEVGAVRLGNSELVAPTFRVIVRPTDFTTERRTAPLQAAVQEFHAELLEGVSKKYPQAAMSKHSGVWVPIGGLEDTGYTLRMTWQQGTAVHLYCEAQNQRLIELTFDRLVTRKSEVEQGIGASLSWTKFKWGLRVRWWKPAPAADQVENREAVRDDMISRYETLSQALNPLITEALTAAKAELEAEEGGAVSG